MLPYRCVSPQCAMPLCQSYTRFDACPVSCLRCMSPCSTPVLLLSLLSPGSRPVSAGSLCCKLVLALPDFKPTQAQANKQSAIVCYKTSKQAERAALPCRFTPAAPQLAAPAPGCAWSRSGAAPGSPAAGWSAGSRAAGPPMPGVPSRLQGGKRGRAKGWAGRAATRHEKSGVRKHSAGHSHAQAAAVLPPSPPTHPRWRLFRRCAHPPPPRGHASAPE